MGLRLLVSDVDGTLLDPEGRLNRRVVRALRRFVEAGGQLSLATGRPPELVLPIARRIHTTLPIVTNNGARIVHPKDGQTIAASTLPAELVRALWEYALGYDVTLFFAGQGTLFGGPRKEELAFWTGLPYLATDPHTFPPADKAVLYGDPQAQQEVIHWLQRQLPGTTAVKNGSGHELLAPGASKGSGVVQLAAMSGISLSETVVVGDELNDLSMLRVAGVAAAVGNALPEVRRTATVLLPPNTQAPLARLAEQLRSHLLQSVRHPLPQLISTQS